MSGSGNIGNISPLLPLHLHPTPTSARVRKVLNIKIRRRNGGGSRQKANSREIILAVFHGIRRKRWPGDLCARSEPRQVARRVHMRAYVSPLKEHARRRRRHHTEEEQDLCVSWHRLTTPFSRSSFRSTSTSSSSSYSRLIAPFSARAIFRPRLSPPTRLPFFLRPSAIRTRQRGNTRAIYPVFRNASEYPHVSCQPRDGPGRGREIHSSFPWNTPTRVALTTRNGVREEMGAIKR